MKRLYLETNFVVGAATGQDPEWQRLVAVPPTDLQICLPDICLMEAFGTVEWKAARLRELGRGLATQARELRRSALAISSRTAADLDQSKIDLGLIADSWLTGMAAIVSQLEVRVSWISTNAAARAASVSKPLIDDLTDNLILHCVLDHAGINGGVAAGFLTANAGDFFGDAAVDAELKKVGVDKFFTKSAKAAEWGIAP